MEIALPDGPSELLRPVQAASAEPLPRASRTRAGSSARVLVAVAAIAGALAAALGVTAFALSIGADPAADISQTPAAGARAAIEILSRPDAERVVFAGSGNRLELVVGPLGRAALVLDGLPAAPEGSAYRAWHRVAGESAPLARFEGTEVAVPLVGLLPPGATVTVTLEPAGNSDVPTGKVLYTATRGI